VHVLVLSIIEPETICYRRFNMHNHMMKCSTKCSFYLMQIADFSASK